MNKSSIAEAVKYIQTAYNLDKDEYIIKAINCLKEVVEPEAYTKPQRLNEIADTIQPPMITSNKVWLDKFLGGGLRREELVLLAGVPHAGKTHLLAYIASQFYLSGYNVLHINGEDLLWDVASVYKKAIGAGITDEGLYLSDMSTNKFSITSIRDMIEGMLKSDIKLDLIVIDYMDIIHIPRRGQDWLDTEALTRDLRFLAKEFQVIIMTASQMNYETSSSGKGLARLFRSKVGKAMNADIVITIDKLDMDFLELNIEKARGRKITDKSLFLLCDWDLMKIELK